MNKKEGNKEERKDEKEGKKERRKREKEGGREEKENENKLRRTRQIDLVMLPSSYLSRLL